MKRFRLSVVIAALAVGILVGMGLLFVTRLGRQHTDAHDTSTGATVPKIATNEKAQRKIVYYRAPMDPKETSPVARKDAMGMDYVAVYEDEVSGDKPVSGLATIRIDPDRQQLIGLKTAEATQGPIGGSIRTVGRVTVDERNVRHINVKVGGFVEEIFVDFVGKTVAKGQRLFRIFSPDLVSVQNEYLLALDTQGALSKSKDAASSGDDLVSAARQRLKFWDISDTQIDALEKTRQPQKTLTLFSPISGVVTQKTAVAGMRLNPGDMPYEITDLSTVWVLADAYEADVPRVAVGMSATFTPTQLGHPYQAKVAFIDPLLDPKTRTAKVRLAFANPKFELKPEMFGEVVLHAPDKDAVRIPLDAIVSSGTKQFVFVSLGDGKFQPREVTTGVAGDDLVEVTSGVKVGEPVVTRANFLIDSESRLKAALSEMSEKK